MIRRHRWTPLEFVIIVLAVVVAGIVGGFFISGFLQNGWIDPFSLPTP